MLEFMLCICSCCCFICSVKVSGITKASRLSGFANGAPSTRLALLIVYLMERTGGNDMRWRSMCFLEWTTESDVLTLVNCNRKLEISTAPTKAKSWEPAYSQALVQKKSIDSGSDPES